VTNVGSRRTIDSFDRSEGIAARQPRGLIEAPAPENRKTAGPQCRRRPVAAFAGAHLPATVCTGNPPRVGTSRPKDVEFKLPLARPSAFLYFLVRACRMNYQFQSAESRSYPGRPQRVEHPVRIVVADFTASLRSACKNRFRTFFPGKMRG